MKSQKYRKKTRIVDAYQTKMLREVDTPMGIQFARPGDWVIKHKNGKLGVAKDSDFQKLYERIDS